MSGKPWKIKNYHSSYESALEEKKANFNMGKQFWP